MVAGPLLVGLGCGLYIGAGLGAGPRDGVMTGLTARGIPTWIARTGIELSALAAGWLLGGTVGVGTVWFALAIGPVAHVALDRFTLDPEDHVEAITVVSGDEPGAQSVSVEHPGLGDVGRHQRRRRDVEGAVLGADAGRGDPHAGELQHLAGVPALDDDGVAVGRGRDRSSTSARPRRTGSVVVGQHGQAVGADLVGDVAVGGDAIGADHDQVDFARRAISDAGHHVGDERARRCRADRAPRR